MIFIRECSNRRCLAWLQIVSDDEDRLYRVCRCGSRMYVRKVRKEHLASAMEDLIGPEIEIAETKGLDHAPRT